MRYFCCHEQRRETLKNRNDFNGIDFLEVAVNQTTLKVYFCNPFFLSSLTPENLYIEGGDRISSIEIDDLTVEGQMLTVLVKAPGDFSLYRLRLVPTREQPLDPFDPMLRAVDFSFKVNCLSELDCKQPQRCPTTPLLPPEIDYLAKDYLSFRQLMLDRLALLLPQWQERNPADLGTVLVELLAYVGDHLSYQQDAIATEAYLTTARQRVSVRRHGRLVDYVLHNGCNARVWVQIAVKDDVSEGVPVVVPSHTQLLTAIPQTEILIPPNASIRDRALSQQPVIFETMHEVTLFLEHNQMSFYTWGDENCCLPPGATTATLAGHYPHLNPGDVLIVAERLGVNSGQAADANRSHRHALRLTQVIAKDSQQNPLKDSLYGAMITEIAWSAEDALPFPLCISGNTEQGYQSEIAVAWGNIVLADNGRTIRSEDLGEVPQPRLMRVGDDRRHSCDPDGQNPTLEQRQIPPRFRPHLSKKQLTHQAFVVKTTWENNRQHKEINNFDPEASASAAMTWNLQQVLPSITLTDNHHQTWQPKRDLLASDQLAKEFVVEMEEDGTAYLRFGDDRYGMRPNSETQFKATYRVGNGTEGNIGAETLAHIVTDDTRLRGVCNPLAAQGGVDPEPLEDVRQKAPTAFRRQERAVTPQDYAEVAQRHPQVQKAAATFRWTGSWYTVFVTVDRFGGLPITAEFESEMRQHLEKYRLAGYDLEVDAPRFVSVDLELLVCVKADYFRTQVKAELRQVFSNRLLPDGRRGVFHPDNWTFGQSVYLSRLYEAALSVTGVESLNITKCQRQGQPDQEALETGVLPLGRLEIARLDNDPNFPERGQLRLRMGGGK